MKPAKCFDVYDADINAALYTLLFSEVLVELTANDTWYNLRGAMRRYWNIDETYVPAPIEDEWWKTRVARGWMNCYRDAEGEMKTYIESDPSLTDALIQFINFCKSHGLTPDDYLFAKIWW